MYSVTLDDSAPIQRHREVYLPDLEDPGTLRLAATPGGCTCTRNYAWPHYQPCIHVRLLRSGAPVDDVRPNILCDGTRVYALKTVERYYRAHRNGYRKGLWEHTLAFDGSAFYVESYHVDEKYFRTVYVGPDWRAWTNHL